MTEKNSLLNNFQLNLLFLLFIAFLLAGPVPGINEYLYLLFPKKVMDPSYLTGDWFFDTLDRSHFIFNLVVAPFTLVFSLEMIGWIGRIICWILTIFAILRLGQNMKLPLWMISLSTLLWFSQGQSMVAGGWVIKYFEAKCFAYICLLFSLNFLIINRTILSAIVLGLSFSFHPSVGMFGILSFGFSLVCIRYPFDKFLKIVILTFLFSLPGIIPILPTIFGGESLFIQDAKFLSLIKMPDHLDPYSFNRRTTLTLYFLILFNWFHYLRNRDNMTFKFLTFFEISLCLFFTIGIGCRVLEMYNLLLFFPFRLFPVFTPLFFFLRLMHAFNHRQKNEATYAIVVSGFIALICLSNPFGGIFDQLKKSYAGWTSGHRCLHDNDITKSFIWISKNTNRDVISIIPPWRPDGWFLTNRAQIACYHFFPYDRRLKDWRKRIESMVGRIESKPETYKNMENKYNSLKQADIEVIKNKYGGDYFVSRTEYEYPIVYSTSSYKVYRVRVR